MQSMICRQAAGAGFSTTSQKLEEALRAMQQQSQITSALIEASMQQDFSEKSMRIGRDDSVRLAQAHRQMSGLEREVKAILFLAIQLHQRVTDLCVSDVVQAGTAHGLFYLQGAEH